MLVGLIIFGSKIIRAESLFLQAQHEYIGLTNCQALYAFFFAQVWWSVLRGRT